MMHQRGWLRSALMGLAVTGLVACDDGAAPTAPTGVDGMDKIEGVVFYRERMMLPPGAEVEVQLQDISRADAMARVLATVSQVPGGAPPYPFVIEYDAAGIDPRMRYALRATISLGDQLMFTSNEYIDPFQGNPVEVLVQRVAEPVQRETAVLEGRRWLLETLAGKPAARGAGDVPADLQFDGDAMRAGGFSGCNRYTGGYSRDGASGRGGALAFKPMAGTLMACQEGAELEREYLQMLGAVTAFTLEGDRLSLLAGPEVVATFRAE